MCHKGVDIMIRIYTAPSCASCRKVKAWLKEQGIPFVEKNIFSTLLRESELKEFFSSIVSAETNVVFTFNKSGAGLVYRIDQRDSQISEDGKIVSVPYNSAFRVFDRHLSLIFTPMTDRQGSTTMKFGILYKKDFRSMGASVTTNSACLVSVSEPTGTMARTTQATRDRCLYGLRLLPLTSQDIVSK